MERKKSFVNIITSFLVTCFLFGCPFFNESHNSTNDQKRVESIHKLNKYEDCAETEEEKHNPYFGGLKRGEASTFLGQEASYDKLPLSQICDDLTVHFERISS